MGTKLAETPLIRDICVLPDHKSGKYYMICPPIPVNLDVYCL